MASEDITFCANRACQNKKCERNPKHIRIHCISHSYAFFDDCPQWKPSGAKWLKDALEGYNNGN